MIERHGSKGFLIPDNPLPAGYRCIALVIPDDDLYLYAIGGQYQYLTQWLAWEKDGTDRASLAASAWKEAYDITMACYWQKDFVMVCSEEKIDELIVATQNIADAINAIDEEGIIDLLTQFLPFLIGGASGLSAIAASVDGLDLSVDNFVTSDPTNNIINKCIECGDVLIIDPDPSPDPDPGDPPGNIPPGDWEDYLCAGANWIYDNVVVSTFNKTQQVEQFIGSSAAIALMVGLMAGTGFGFALIAIVALIAAIAAIVDLDNRADVLAEIESFREDVICGIVTASGASSARSFIEGETWNTGVLTSSSQWVINTISLSVLNELFLGQNTAFEEGYAITTPCDMCGATLSPMTFNLDSDYLGSFVDPIVSNGDPIYYGLVYQVQSESISSLHRMQFEVFGNDGNTYTVTMTVTYTSGHIDPPSGVCLIVNNGLPSQVDVSCNGNVYQWAQPAGVPLLRPLLVGDNSSVFTADIVFTPN
jgi:hypothetical protein